MSFINKIQKRWRDGTSVCVGLDPFPEKMPKHVPDVLSFNKAIVDATGDLACCFKPQFAHFAALAAEAELKATIRYCQEQYPFVPVILDSKRGDIGSTAAMYAKEAFEHYNADAVTVNPYMGSDTVLPFAEHADRGVIVLCRTSNPSAAEFQNQLINGLPLYLHVAKMAQEKWNKHGNISLVVGATAPEEMARIREVAPELPFLVPGIGAQGGDLKSAVQSGQFANGNGLMINSSRGILYASSGEDFASKAREETLRLKAAIVAAAS